LVGGGQPLGDGQAGAVALLGGGEVAGGDRHVPQPVELVASAGWYPFSKLASYREGLAAGRLMLWPASGLWRHGNYLLFWGAQGISAFGSQVTLVALPLVAILTIEASAFEVAVLTALEFAPFIFLSVPAGVWVDRLRRRPILIVTDIGRGASLASIPVAYALGAITLPHLYAVALVNGALTVFFTLAYQAYLPSLVEREHLVDANARFEGAETAARLAGPGAGGGLVSLLSAPVAVLADALSFLVSASLIFSIRDREAETGARSASEDRRPFWIEIREGGRFALKDIYVRSVLASAATLNVGLNMVWAILLVYAVRELNIGPGMAGLVLSVGEVGGLLAVATTSWLTSRAGPGPVIIGSAGLFGPALFLLALAPASMPLPCIVAGWAVSSFASVLYNSTTVGLRQARVPHHLQGRVVGFNRAIVWGVSPVGAVIGGALATAVGMRSTMIVGAVVAFAAVVPAVFSPLRSLRQLPENAEPEPGTAPFRQDRPDKLPQPPRLVQADDRLR
jgi:MFS family permease